MKVQITSARTHAGGYGYDSIDSFTWANVDNGTSGWVSTSQLVHWLRRSENEAWIAGANGPVPLEVVEHHDGIGHIQARRDGLLNDDLMDLPGAVKRKPARRPTKVE